MKLLTIDASARRITVGRTVIPLSTLELFYYRFFAERVKKNAGPSITDGSTDTPKGFADAIRNYELEAYPDREVKPVDRRPPSIITFRTTISRINSRILKTLGEKEGPAYQIHIDGARGSRRYYLALKKSEVRIKTSTVIDLYRKKVYVFTSNQPLTEVLDAIREKDFTQTVIRINGKLRLLSTEGIARWMAAQPRKKAPPLVETTIGNVLQHEREDNMLCVEPELSILEAREYFSRRLESSRPNLLALIITARARTSETPLGIITAADFLDKRYW